MYEWREYKEEADENIEAWACEWKTDISLLLEFFFMQKYNQYQWSISEFLLFNRLLVTDTMFFKIIYIYI